MKESTPMPETTVKETKTLCVSPIGNNTDTIGKKTETMKIVPNLRKQSFNELFWPD